MMCPLPLDTHAHKDRQSILAFLLFTDVGQQFTHFFFFKVHFGSKLLKIKADVWSQYAKTVRASCFKLRCFELNVRMYAKLVCP